MALSTLQYASGDLSELALGETRRRFVKRRRSVWSQQQHRPLFVAEAEFRAGLTKYLSRPKKAMLALFGVELLVVDVAALDADAGGDVTAASALRCIPYVELLGASLCGPGGASLRIEHGAADKARLWGLTPAAAAAAAATGSSSNSSEADALTQGGGYAASLASTPAGGAAAAAVRVEAFTLVFSDRALAQQAAAAILFQQAQHAALRNWLSEGLHAGFRCDLVSIQALPLHFGEQQHHHHAGGASGLSRAHSLLPPHVRFSAAGSVTTSAAGAPSGTSGGAASTAGGAGAAAAAAAPYPWADALAAEGWGCSVPLPASWAAVLDAAAAGGTARGAASSSEDGGADEPDVTLEELSCPVALEHGPKALQVTLSTPLGAALATITPQLCRAALVSSSCRDVLALPLHPPGHSSQGVALTDGAPQVAFSWTVASRVASSSAPSTTAPSTAADVFENGDSVGSNLSGLAGTASSEGDGAAAPGSDGLTVQHSLEVYAALTIEVVRTPGTAGQRGAGTVFSPDAHAQHAQPPQPAAGAQAGSSGGAEQQQQQQQQQAAPLQGNPHLQLQAAALVLLAGIACQQLSSQPLLALLQLALLGGLAAVAWGGAAAKGARVSSSSSSSTGGAKPTALQEAGEQQLQRQQSAVTAVHGKQESSSSSTEDVTCLGWSVRVVCGDVCAAPSRHLQLQASLARSSRSMARVRLRMASMSAGGANLPLLAAAQLAAADEGSEDEEGGDGLPVLVSDPEPAWLSPDTKQRFLNAKPTLEASQEQARRTHKWREHMQVDSVLLRPCPGFEAMRTLLPTYLLTDDSPEGHAVVLMQVGGINDLCNAIFCPPAGTEPLSLLQAEHALSLLNEYLVQVAAPRPVPAGFQYQVYDLEGFKLAQFGSNMLTLFKMLVRFGHYYPERLQQALVINAPGWFTYPWRVMNSFMDANTAAKVVVVGSPKAALPHLSHLLGGIENVPVAWGGRNATPLEDFPANRRMIDFGRRLNAGEQPLRELAMAGGIAEAARAFLRAESGA